MSFARDIRDVERSGKARVQLIGKKKTHKQMTISFNSKPSQSLSHTKLLGERMFITNGFVAPCACWFSRSQFLIYKRNSNSKREIFFQFFSFADGEKSFFAEIYIR